MPHLKLATRGSALALAQSRTVAAALAATFPDLTVELLAVRTTGDTLQEKPLREVGGKGLFTREIDAALLRGEADLAVHSMKDLPTTLAPGTALAAVPERGSDADVLAGFLGASPETLPRGALIGCGSLRRGAQLRRWRPDLEIVDVRGNVETRLKKAEEHGWAGTVLAAAGLRRLGLTDVPHVSLAERLLPAAGQGALAVTARADDEATRALLQAIHHRPGGRRVAAERAFLQTLGAGCHAPAGIRTRIDAGCLTLEGAVFLPSGSREVRATLAGDPEAAAALGKRLAWLVLGQGGGEILAETA